MRYLTCLLLASVFSISPAYSQDYSQRYQYMSPKQVQKKWGNKAFAAKNFRNSHPKIRAKMAFSIIKSNLYIGQSLPKIFSELGPSTGYFFSESVPAYIIGDINEKPDEVWQLVFLLSKDSKKIETVRVQKKCCYKR